MSASTLLPNTALRYSQADSILVWVPLGRLFHRVRRVFDRELRPRFRVVRLVVLLSLVLRMELVVLDIVYVLGVIALFVVVGLLGKAVEKL